jgi:hypothetical protein
VPRPMMNSEVDASLAPPVDHGRPLTGQLGGLQGGFQIGMGGAQGQFNLGVGGLNVGLGGGAGGRGKAPAAMILGPSVYQPLPLEETNRPTYAELMERRKQVVAEARERARNAGSMLADRGVSEATAVNAGRIGEGFRHALDRKVSVPRRKSALLRVFEADVEATRVSVYNRGIHPHFPLQALKLKNTSGRHLQQGPVSVMEGGEYVGDARLPDMQPDQEKLISYAMDLGLEVKVAEATMTERHSKSASNGALHYRNKKTLTSTYRLNNRSKTDRLLLVEHPRGGADLLPPAVAEDRNEDFLRFAWKAQARKTSEQPVSERTESDSTSDITGYDAKALRTLAESDELAAPVRAGLRKLAEQSDTVEAARQELAEATAKREPLVEQQERALRQIDRLPATSAAHKKALEQFTELEVAIVAATKTIREKSDRWDALRRERETLRAAFTVK